MSLAHRPQKNTQKAFTLIELMVTLSVLGVLLAIALPNLRDFIVSNRLSSQVNGFVGLLNYARSEAIARNQPVLVCAKRLADNECVTTDSWAAFETQVFVDVDGNNSWSTGDILLKRIAPLDVGGSETTFKRHTNATFIEFNTAGLGIIAHRFDINAINTTDSAYETKYGRTICISRPGRARVVPLRNTECPTF